MLAAPEVTAATLYGFFDVLSATRRGWQVLHGGDMVASPFRPLVVSRDGLPFTGANGVRITPDASLADRPRPDVVCITDIAVAPGEPLGDRFDVEVAWLRPPPGRARPRQRSRRARMHGHERYEIGLAEGSRCLRL